MWTTSENVAPVGQLSLNFARNKNSTLDAAMDKARTTLDQDVQKEQYKIWQEQLAADIPYIWLYETQAVVIASTKVHDVTKATLPDGQPQLSMVSVVHPLAQVWISE